MLDETILPLGRREFTKGLALAAMFTTARSASGLWLPLGGMDVDESGWDRKRLVAALHKLNKQYADKPYIVTRTKQFVTMLNHAWLCVNPKDKFVYWIPDCNLLHKFCVMRMRAFSAGKPELERVCLAWPGMKPDITPQEAKIRSVLVACLDREHTCPDWEWLLRHGPKGLAENARRRYHEVKNPKQRLFLKCVVECHEAFARLLVRWAGFAETKGMAEAAKTLRELSEHEPRTFREALQLALVYDTCQYIEDESVRSQGRFDKLFIKFYRDDIAAGRETRASAKELVKDWFLRMYVKNPSGNPGKNVAIGGYDDNGEPLWNELTDIALELHYELNNPSPKFNYNFGSKTPSWQLEKVTHCIADGRTGVVFGNVDVVREALIRRGKSRDDANDFVLNGCHQPNAAGREIIASMAAEVNLAKAVESVFGGGKDFNGIEIGPPCDLPADYAGFEHEYLRQADALVKRTLEWTRGAEEHWYDLNPSPFMSGCFRDCVKKAKDISQGGCKYNMSGCLLEALPTVVDSLAAIKFLVDEKKLVTMAELGDILRKDWEGREELRLQSVRLAPKWGNNNESADKIGKMIYDRYSKLVNETPNGHGGMFQAGFWTVDHDKALGEHLAATPDGRRRGKPIARNNSASTGCGTEGPTALMNSNAKLDLANCPDGHILDVILPTSLAKMKDGAAKIAAIARSYFNAGGQIVHFNCFDSRTLRDAMAHPEKYPDLQVRVCGWNERWVNLPRWEQEIFLETVAAQGF